MGRNNELHDLSIKVLKKNSDKKFTDFKYEAKTFDDKIQNEWNNFLVTKCYVIEINNSEKQFDIDIDVVCKSDEFAFIVEDGYLKEFNSLSHEVYFIRGLLTEDKEFQGEDLTILSYQNKIRKFSQQAKKKGKLALNLFIGKLRRETESKINVTEGELKNFNLNEDKTVSLLEVSSVKINPKKDIAIFVHGLASEVGQNFEGLYKYLIGKYNVFAFSYPTITNSIEENGKSLKVCLDELLKPLDKESVTVFAHSMGGLVSRSALRQNAPIKNLVMAGTPNNGADMADFLLYHFIYCIRGLLIGIIPKELRKALKKVKPSKAVGLKDLRYGSEFIIALNSYDMDNSENFKKYFTLAGNKYRISDKAVKVNNVGRIRDFKTRNEFQLNGFVQKWEHSEYYEKNDGKLNNAMKMARIHLT